jgi:transaldolase
MPTLRRLYDEQGQSPWLDNLARRELQDGTMLRLVTSGVGGVTAKPTNVAPALESSDLYHQKIHNQLKAGQSVE